MTSYITRLLRSLDSIQTSLLIFCSFLVFYTMYDKGKRKLVPNNLFRLLTMQYGFDKFLVEMNKAISLSGLSVLCFSFFPIYSSRAQLELFYSAVTQLWIHFLYSLWKYYGTNNIPVVSSFVDLSRDTVKKVSILSGLAGQIVLSLGFFSYTTNKVLCTFGIVFGMLHFHAMEIDHKFVLRVRPFAYVVFPLAFFGMFYGAKYI